jgi:uncharacterized protein
MLRNIILGIVIAAVLILPSSLGARGKRPKFPEPVGYVNDFAGTVSPQAEGVMSAIAAEVKAKTGAEIAVAIVRSTGGMDIEEYATALFVEWGIGEEREDNGLLILVAMEDKDLWIKPGYGLEGAIPDAVAHEVYRDILRPGFRAGQYDRALVTATKALAEHIVAESGQTLAFADSVPDAYLLARETQTRYRHSPLSPFLPLLFLFFPVLFLVLRLASGRAGYRGRRGGFWIGGFGGRSGGFGGGFGGFGGGSAGGAGAGGGW